MNCSKFLLIAAALFAGTFGHRFGRHLINENVVDGAVGMANLTVGSRDKLASDDNDENDVVVLTEPNAKVDVELLYGKLEFKFCSPGCMGQNVSVCFVAANGKYNKFAKGQCVTNGHCEFRANVTLVNNEKILFLLGVNTQKVFDGRMCTQVVMNFPTTTFDGELGPPSCDPLKRDKVVTLYVQQASGNCPLKVLGAKRWYPPTSSTPEVSNVTAPTSLSVSSESSTSDSNMGLWIALGIIGGIVIIAVLVGLGYCIYRIRKQKKSPAAEKQIQPLSPKATDAPPAPAPLPVVVKEEPVKQVTKETTKVEPGKPKKVKAEQKKEGKKKETAADKVYTPMPFLGKKETEHDEMHSFYEVAPAKQRTAETQQESPSNGNDATNEAVEDSTTHGSVDQKPGLTVSVCDEPILPRKPYNSNVEKDYYQSRKSGSLSARHDPLLEKVLEDPPNAWKQLFEKTRLSRKQVQRSEVKYNEMQAFYPAYKKPTRYLGKREEACIFFYRVSGMMKKLAEWIMAAEVALKQRGVQFGKDGRITVFPKKQILEYLLEETTHSYIRSFAFGAYFHREIDAVVDGKGPIASIPLLFVIVMQRRYTVESRKKACAWIRRQMLVILKCYHRTERKKLAYPICAIETAWEMDQNNFLNVSNIHTDSEDEHPPKLHRDIEKELAARKKIIKENQ